MSLKLTILKYLPNNDPNLAFLKVGVTGNYTQVTGDTLNLTPSTWLDPSALGVVGPTAQAAPAVPPGIFEENLAGYYAQVVPGTTLSNSAIRFFQPGGAELAAGAYPAAITGGNLVIAFPL